MSSFSSLTTNIVTGYHSRYGSVLMLALWVSLSRSRSGICAEFKKIKNRKEKGLACHVLSRDISARGRSHQRVPFIARYSEACFSSIFTKKGGSVWYPVPIHEPIRLAILIRVGPAILSTILYPIIAQRYQEIHGVTVSGSAKIAYCFPGQNVILFLSLISESNLFRFDTRYKLFAGFCTLNHSIYMLLYVAKLDFFLDDTRFV